MARRARHCYRIVREKSSCLVLYSLREPSKQAVAEREGFEPSVEVLPLRRFSKPLPSATRPPLHWSQLFMRGSQSSATQVDDRRKTSKRAVIIPQATWEVQAIREVDQEKLSGEDGKGSHV